MVCRLVFFFKSLVQIPSPPEDRIALYTIRCSSFSRLALAINTVSLRSSPLIPSLLTFQHPVDQWLVPCSHHLNWSLPKHSKQEKSQFSMSLLEGGLPFSTTCSWFQRLLSPPFRPADHWIWCPTITTTKKRSVHVNWGAGRAYVGFVLYKLVKDPFFFGKAMRIVGCPCCTIHCRWYMWVM